VSDVLRRVHAHRGKRQHVPNTDESFGSQMWCSIHRSNVVGFFREHDGVDMNRQQPNASWVDREVLRVVSKRNCSVTDVSVDEVESEVERLLAKLETV